MLDLLSNKNAKNLLHKFNDWIASMGAEKFLIRHTSKVRDKIGLRKNRGKIWAVIGRKNYSE